MRNDPLIAVEMAKTAKFVLMAAVAFSIPLRVFTRHAQRVIRVPVHQAAVKLSAVVAICAIATTQIAIIAGDGTFTVLGQLGIWGWVSHVVIANVLAAMEQRTAAN